MEMEMQIRQARRERDRNIESCRRRTRNRKVRGQQGVFKVIGFFTDKANLIGIRKLMLDRVLKQRKFREQKQAGQQKDQGFELHLAWDCRHGLGIFKKAV